MLNPTNLGETQHPVSVCLKPISLRSRLTQAAPSAGGDARALEFGHFPMTAERSRRIAQRALALGEVTPSDAPCKGVRPIGVSIPNIAFVEGDPVAFENFLDLIANLLGTQERPIGRLS